MLGDGGSEFVEIAPGAQTILAQHNKNFQQADIVLAGLRFIGPAPMLAGESLTLYQPVAVDSGDNKVYLADSNGTNFRFNCLGVIAKNYVLNDPVIIIWRGLIPFIHSFSPGSPVFLSTTPGQILGTGTRQLGVALPSNQILLDPTPSWAAS